MSEKKQKDGLRACIFSYNHSRFFQLHASFNFSKFQRLHFALHNQYNWAAWNGEIAFDLYGTNGLSYLVVMDTNGTVLNLRESARTGDYNAAYFLSSDLMLFQGELRIIPGNSVWLLYPAHIWNLATNTTEDFPNVLGEHDIQYDTVNNTFLTLQDYVRQIGNNQILFDNIVQFSANGTVLWIWDIYGHIPLSEASPFNETATTGSGQTVIDFTHANSLDWDYNDSVIYLNIRNTNTFYAINQTRAL